MTEQPPFTNTGVDFAGPLYIRYPGSTRSNKVWLCLFTCCVVRAVHLDLVPDMTTTAFLRCMKRFVARRGLPRRIVSDNAQTFKCAAKSITAMLSQQDVQQYLSGNKVQWVFNVEKAPWWGGIFERMIKSTKRCLRKVIGRAKLHYDELITALTEIEAVINSRPLTYLSPDNLEEPLTPSHFLCGRRILNLPDCLQQDDVDEEFELQ
ncbi:MAG: transposase family protein [Nitrosopumilus sp.]|nr:transposase family protein [Nitrosopumilus sp.]